MKKKLVAVVVAIAAVALYAGLQQTDAISVSVVQVVRGDVIASVTNTRAGTVDACRRAGIAPATGGNIVGLYVKDGDRVVKDQLLLELWNIDLQARVKLAERDVIASRSMSRQWCVSAGVADKAAARLLQLKKGDLASQEAVERAVGEAESTAAACDASRDQIEVKKAAVDVALASLQRTQLRAPFDGVIAEINGELGEWVTPSPVGIPTPPTVDIIDNSCLFIRAPIDEVDAPRVRAGLPAWITLDAFKDRRFSGKVQRVAPYVLDIEKQSRTVDVEAVIDDPDMMELLPGYSADVEVILDERHDVLYLPTSVVLEDSTVFVVAPKGGQVEKRTIETGLKNWEQTEIVAGLQEGDTVVRSINREGLEDGVLVQIETP